MEIRDGFSICPVFFTNRFLFVILHVETIFLAVYLPFSFNV